MTVSCIETSELQMTTGHHQSDRPDAPRPTPQEHELHRVRRLMAQCLTEVGHGPARQASEYQINTGGSLLRARLALISGSAFKASAEYRIAAAAACELVHNASLVHDDLCDGDLTRRNQATVWRRFGKDVALCSGDLLLCAAFNATSQVADPVQSRDLTRLVAQLISSVIVGQSLEVAVSPDDHRPDFREYLRATKAKTAPLIQLPLAAGALAGSDSRRVSPVIERLSQAIGLAYQILDDLDDLQLTGPNLHRFHAWHHHRVPGNDCKAARVNRAVRHALAALARARHQLRLLSEMAPSALDDQLLGLIEQLHEKALLNTRSFTDETEQTAYVSVRNSN